MVPERMPDIRMDQVAEAEATIHAMLTHCIPHGFFSITITGRTNKQGRVEVLVEGGPSIKHTIETTLPDQKRDSWSGSAYERTNTNHSQLSVEHRSPNGPRGNR